MKENKTALEIAKEEIAEGLQSYKVQETKRFLNNIKGYEKQIKALKESIKKAEEQIEKIEELKEVPDYTPGCLTGCSESFVLTSTSSNNITTGCVANACGINYRN